MKEKICQTLRSRADAKSKLQNPVDMGAPSRIWIPRDGYCGILQGWSREAANTPICAVIGEEGAGKTWLMFDWWRREIEGENPPLIVWISAREIASNSLCEVIGAAIAKWISVPKRDAQFWSRRVELWRSTLRDSNSVPSIWLMLDGINEGTSQQQVMEVLAEAVNSEWKGVVGILLSDRPIHWQRQFRFGNGIETRPRTVSVGLFTDKELDDVLAGHGKSREAFSAKVLEIIKWPSWFAVAAELFDKDHDWSAHSVEQLMLHYVQYRLEQRPQISSMDEETFRSFMSELGAEMQANWARGKKFSRAELKERLSGYSGEPDKNILEAVDDITSGLWMKRDGPNQFIIDKAVLPFAISLALLSQLRSATTEEETDSESERFLGPIEDRDIGVNILGSAISLAFIDPEIADNTRKALLKRWMRGHNFGPSHFELLWRIGSATPHTLFSVAEDLWLQQAAGSSVDELLIKGIANIATDGGCQESVISFIAKWAGTYWLDSRAGEFIGYHPTEDQLAASTAATEGRLQRLRADVGDDALSLTPLSRCSNGVGASWTFYRIISIATYLPRAAQAPIWRGWALSRAVMGNARHFEDLAWLLRINPFDGPSTTKRLLETVDDLLALKSDGVREMALALLEAHGGPEAAAKLTSIGSALQTRRRHGYEDRARVVDNIVSVVNETDQTDRSITFFLSNFAYDSDVQISSAHLVRLERYALEFPVNDLGSGGGQTAAADIDLKLAEPALARWTPEAYADLYRRYMSTLSEREEEHLLGMTFSLDRHLVLVTEEQQRQIEAILIARVADHSSNLDQISRALLHAALFDRTAEDQYDLWTAINAPEQVPTTLESLIRQVPEDLLRRIEIELDLSGPRDRLVSWLAYLTCSSPVEFPEGWESLGCLFDHNDSLVRYLAFELALKKADKRLAHRLLDSDWAASHSRGYLENWAGSSLLSLAADAENFESISDRIDPQWSGNLWESLKYDSNFSNPFRTFFKTSVERELSPPSSRTFPEYRCAPATATLRLLEQDGTLVGELAERLFAQKYAPSFVKYEWPRMEILKAFFSKDPPCGVIYWKKMDVRGAGLRVTSESFDDLPFEADDNDETCALRDTLVMQAQNDWALIGIGASIARHQRAAWAVRRIKQMLAHPTDPSEIARAIMLAGFLDDSAAARGLWAEELGRAPLGGWIGVVYNESKFNIQRSWRALEWLDTMFAAETDEHFFACWRLFVRSVDRRSAPIAARHARQTLSVLNPRRKDFIALNWGSVEDSSNSTKSDREGRLFSIRIGHRWALPWGNS